MNELEPRPVPRRGISPVLIIFFFTGMIGMLVAAAMLFSEDAAPGTPANMVGNNAARPLSGGREAVDFTLPALDGTSVSLADYAGRAVFLNFWATWCVPCVQEMPAFQQFARQQGDDGAVVLAVNFGESPEDIAPFLEGIGVTDLTILLDTDFAVANDYGVGNLPTTYLIDAEGTLRYLKLGEMDLNEMGEYLAALQPEEG